MNKNKEPRVLFWDIEVSPMVATTWRVGRNINLTIENILEDWYIICACWKWAGQKTVHAASMAEPGDDREMVMKVRDVLASADLIVHHYGDAFDLKKFNARLIYHRLPPLPDIPTVDTKKAAAKVAAFSSNKLEYLTKTFTGEGKIKTEYELWLKCRIGNKAALREMIRYNKQDVVKLEEWYDILKPYIKNHPHIWAKYKDRFHTCRNCGSDHIKKNGTKVTKAGVLKQEVQCLECFSYSRIPVVKI